MSEARQIGQGDAEETARTGVFGRSTLPLVRIAGIDVRIDYSWFFIFLLILVSLAVGYFPQEYPEARTASYWIAGAVAALLLFASILAHEFSHALMARRRGIQVPAITLFLFGGVSHMEDDSESPSTELRVAAVGPFASFGLAVVFWGLHAALPSGTPELFAAVVRYLGWINLALGVFNLLPGLPLDGGRVLRAAVWWKTGSLRRGTRVAADAGKGLAWGLMILGGLQIFGGALLGGVWLILIGMFLRGTAEASYQNLVMRQALEELSVADVAVRELDTVESDTSVESLIEDHVLKHGFRAFPVLKGGRVQGLVSVTDLADVAPEARARTRVEECMKPLDDALRVSPDLPLTEALSALAGAPGGRLLVMRDGELEGMLSRSGLARWIEIRDVLGRADSHG